MTEVHESEPFYWSVDSPLCPHEMPDPEANPDAHDDWEARHPRSDDGHVCLDAPAGNACAGCSSLGDMVPWANCRERDQARPARGVVPNPDAGHQSVPVWIGPLDCFERECDDYFDEDGNELSAVDRCSHIREESACSCQRQDDGEYSLNPCPAAVPV